MDGNGKEIWGLLGRIDAKLDAAHEKDTNFRQDIKGIFEEIKENSIGIRDNKTSIEGVTKDIDDNIRPAIKAAQNKGIVTGGAGSLTGIAAFLKSLVA